MHSVQCYIHANIAATVSYLVREVGSDDDLSPIWHPSVSLCGSVVVRASDSKLDGRQFDSQAAALSSKNLGKLFTPTCPCRSQMVAWMAAV